MGQELSLPGRGHSQPRIDPWLADKGFRDHPFARWDAGSDEHLTYCYVDLDEFDLLQDIEEPCVFLAGPGCGKTAQRQMLAAHYRPLEPDSDWLAVQERCSGSERGNKKAPSSLRRQ